MVKFKRMSGTLLPSTITTVVGSALDLKLEPDPGETVRVPIPIQVAPSNLAQIQRLDVRTKANFTTFKLAAIKAGTIKLTAGTDPNKPVAGPIVVTIEEKIALLDEKTDAGLLLRLLLAETPSPDMSSYSEADVETVMTWMRVVVNNRLAKPSARYGSAGAKKIIDIVRSPRQFEGFEQYPSLAAEITERLDKMVRIANDSGDGRREKYRSFIAAALKVAALPSVSDPSATGLYFWRTSGSGAPSKDAKVFRTLMGNTFYTL